VKDVDGELEPEEQSSWKNNPWVQVLIRLSRDRGALAGLLLVLGAWQLINLLFAVLTGATSTTVRDVTPPPGVVITPGPGVSAEAARRGVISAGGVGVKIFGQSWSDLSNFCTEFGPKKN